MARRTKVENDAEALDIIHGLSTKLSHVDVITLGGVDYNRTDLIVLFRGVLEAERGTAVAKGKWMQAVANERKVRAKVAPIRNLLRSHLESTYGKGSAVAAAHGFRAKERKKPSVKTRVEAIAKRKATREARGTMGKRQRLKIKGTLPPDDGSKKKGRKG
jgi:hypothetical protein